MDVAVCKYHADFPARWRCEPCGIRLCHGCAQPGAQGGRSCPLCGQALQPYAELRDGAPVEERIAGLPHLPLHPRGLRRYLPFVALTPLLFVPWLDWLVWALLIGSAGKYAGRMLWNAAHGQSDPDLLPRRINGGTRALRVAWLGGLGIAALAVYAALTVGMIPALVVLAVLAFLAPLPAAALAVDPDPAKSLRPARLRAVARELGAAGPLTGAVVAAVGVGALTLGAGAWVWLPQWLWGVPAALLLWWALCVAGLVIGALVQARAVALGVVAPVVDDADLRTPPGEPLMHALNALIAEKRYAQARERLERVLAEQPRDEHRERLWRLLLLMRDGAAILALGRGWLPALLAAKKYARAIDVYAGCAQADPAFTWDDAEASYAMAAYAQSVGRFDTALRLLAKFSDRFRGHARIPEAYFLAAKILFENKGQDAQAQKILEGLLVHFSDSAQAEEVKKYLMYMKRVQMTHGQRREAAPPADRDA